MLEKEIKGMTASVVVYWLSVFYSQKFYNTVINRMNREIALEMIESER